ncbi:MAG: MBL fold metallo-hydrolase [Ruminococcus sp.]|nr:MBL fold metallo-hydrolase [Ruminococcus sp.]
MKIERVVSELLMSNMYILEESGHGIIIDPCRDTSAFSPDICYDRIILTHEHFDHISGVLLWQDLTGAQVICSRKCADNIKSPAKNMSRYFSAFCELQTFMEVKGPVPSEEYACTADEVFTGSMGYEWNGHRFELIECSGHSPGSILILVDEKILFSGDTILKEFPPDHRMSGKTGKVRAVREVPRISELRGGLTVYPGHLESFRI